MSCRYRGWKFPLTEVVMPSNKKPPWGPGPPASQASPSSAEQGIFRCRAGVGGQGSHAAMESPEALMCPLEKGVRGIETSGSGYLRQQIRGGRKGRAERQGLGQSPNEKNRGGIKISGLCRWLAFAAFLVLIEMKFRCARMIFRSYAQIKSISGKVLAMVLSNQWAYRQYCESSCNLLMYKLLYGFKTRFSICSLPYKNRWMSIFTLCFKTT